MGGGGGTRVLLEKLLSHNCCVGHAHKIGLLLTWPQSLQTHTFHKALGFLLLPSAPFHWSQDGVGMESGGLFWNRSLMLFVACAVQTGGVVPTAALSAQTASRGCLQRSKSCSVQSCYLTTLKSAGLLCSLLATYVSRLSLKNKMYLPQVALNIIHCRSIMSQVLQQKMLRHSQNASARSIADGIHSFPL